MPKLRYSQDYSKFLTLLKEGRLASGLTQEEVARQLGKEQSYVSKCESGERRVDVAELSEFARLYDKPVSFFFPSED